MEFQRSNIAHVIREIETEAERCGRKKEEITLVVVTKEVSLDQVQALYQLGYKDFAENRIDQALQRKALLPNDIRWHFIGKLQRNKVAKTIGSFFLIHSVDSIQLLQKIARLSLEKNVTTSILIEVNTSGEESKSGLSPEVCLREFSSFVNLKGIEIQGLMTMAPYTRDEFIVRNTFKRLRQLKEEIETQLGHKLKILSMGMSNDFLIAIQEGANMLRIGSRIFEKTS